MRLAYDLSTPLRQQMRARPRGRSEPMRPGIRSTTADIAALLDTLDDTRYEIIDREL